jgi:transcriptional regulator with XRE-family HTH domain
MGEMRPERMGYRLKLLREAEGMKPAEISDYLGIERPYWSRFEGGKRAITESFAALLVDRFNVTLDFLILGRWENLPFDVAERMRQVAHRLEQEIQLAGHEK